MTSLYFGVLRDGVPADEKTVRSTTEPYDMNAGPAMMDSAPDKNEFQTDPNPSLGMVTRQLASKWVQGVKTAPFWRGDVDDSVQHNLIVDRQVSTSGHAASKEAAGEWGHGTLSYAEGIEPVSDLVDGGRMGNEYFKAEERIIQETADNTMMSIPPGYEQSLKGSVSATGKVDARTAAMAAYDTWWNGGK